MYNFLEKIRNKPDRTKKQMAFVTAFCFAGVIFIVWFSIIYPNWHQAQNKENLASQLEPGPLETLGGIISTGVSSISDEVDKAKNTISSFASTTTISTSTNSTIEE